MRSLQAGSMRDEGAGKTTKYGVQWANSEVLEDLVKELDEVRDKIGDDEMMSVAKVMMTSLFKATSRGG